MEARWSQRTADWLLALLQQAVQYVVHREGTAADWMKPFTAVWVEDGSSVSLPDALAGVWRGCGGSRAKEGKASKIAAAVKATLRMDLKGGQWQGPSLQDGRRHEASSPVSTRPMAPGAVCGWQT